MSLTTADLDRLAASCHCAGLPQDKAIILASRLQVAIDELPLPEGWHVSEIRRMRSLANVVCWRVIAIGPGNGDFSEVIAPTMLDSVLALGDALRSRT